MQDALKGITILEVGVMTPGKFCGFLMTGWGARSIRIEREGFPDHITNEDLLLNRGKQSIVLNLRDAADRRTLLDLARDADVLIESYRPGVTTRLGIDYDTIRAINPGIIYCSLSGFGQSGEEAQRAAYDLIFQAESGLLHALNANITAVAGPQTYLTDATSGVMAAFAISAALQGRSGNDGAGRHIDLSMQETVFSLLSVSHGTMRDGVAISGDEAAARSQRAAFNIYGAGDGRAIALTAISESSCKALFRYFNREDLWQQGLVPGTEGREATAFLRQQFASQSAQFWVDALSALDIEIALVKTPTEAYDSPQLQGRNMILDTRDQAGQSLRQIGFPGTATGTRALEPAPEPGTHQTLLKKGLSNE